MQRKTANKVANLLCSVAVTLDQQGRPRKRPGQPRPEARTWYGRSCRPTNREATTYSLVGALKANAKNLGYGYMVRIYATYAIVDETNQYHGGGFDELIDLDEKTADTRTLIRLVKKAQKTTERRIGVAA